MSFALLALLLLATGVEASGAPPDHTGRMLDSFSGPPATIRSHEGATRMDFPRHNGGIESEYGKLGSPSVVIAVRSLEGEVTTLWVRPDGAPPPIGEDGWEDLGSQRVLAGETCRMQRPTGSNDAMARRCVTADGVNLLPRREGRLMQMATIVRGPVDPKEVTPPLELTDLRRWAPVDTFIDKPGRSVAEDYVSTFAKSAKVVRRSGDWTSIAEKPSTLSLVNETVGLEVRIAGAARDDLWIRRFAPGRRFGAFVFKPDAMEGRATETLFGEVCHWRSRPTSPDSNQFECRAKDGALLAIGDQGMHGQAWEAASTFRRKPVPLAAILPAAK